MHVLDRNTIHKTAGFFVGFWSDKDPHWISRWGSETDLLQNPQDPYVVLLSKTRGVNQWNCRKSCESPSAPEVNAPQQMLECKNDWGHLWVRNYELIIKKRKSLNFKTLKYDTQKVTTHTMPQVSYKLIPF